MNLHVSLKCARSACIRDTCAMTSLRVVGLAMSSLFPVVQRTGISGKREIDFFSSGLEYPLAPQFPGLLGS